VKRFDADYSKHVLKPSSSDKKAASGAVAPNGRHNVQRRNDGKATRVACNGAYRFLLNRPSMHPLIPDVPFKTFRSRRAKERVALTPRPETIERLA
jgi:hypothetical protein